MTTTFHWHAHGVADVCFTSDGELCFHCWSGYISYPLHDYMCSQTHTHIHVHTHVHTHTHTHTHTYTHIHTHTQEPTCCLVGKSQCSSSGSWSPIKSSSGLVLVLPLSGWAVALVTAILLSHCRAMVGLAMHVSALCSLMVDDLLPCYFECCLIPSCSDMFTVWSGYRSGVYNWWFEKGLHSEP